MVLKKKKEWSGLRREYRENCALANVVKEGLLTPIWKTPQPSGPHFLCWGNTSLSCGRIPISQAAPALRIGEEGYSPLTISYRQLDLWILWEVGTPHPPCSQKFEHHLQSGLPSEVPHCGFSRPCHTVPWSVFTGKKATLSVDPCSSYPCCSRADINNSAFPLL